MSTVGAMARLVRAERAIKIALREVEAARAELHQKPQPGPREEVRQRLGAWLRAHRDEQGLSRDVLSRQIGISKGTLKNIERALHVPCPATLMRLLRGLPLPDDLADPLAVAAKHRK